MLRLQVRHRQRMGVEVEQKLVDRKTSRAWVSPEPLLAQPMLTSN